MYCFSRCGHVEKQDGLKSPSQNGVAKTDVSTQSTLEKLLKKEDKANHTDSLPKSTDGRRDGSLSPEQEVSDRTVAMVQLKLDEAKKTIKAERE